MENLNNTSERDNGDTFPGKRNQNVDFVVYT